MKARCWYIALTLKRNGLFSLSLSLSLSVSLRGCRSSTCSTVHMSFRVGGRCFISFDLISGQVRSGCRQLVEGTLGHGTDDLAKICSSQFESCVTSFSVETTSRNSAGTRRSNPPPRTPISKIIVRTPRGSSTPPKNKTNFASRPSSPSARLGRLLKVAPSSRR